MEAMAIESLVASVWRLDGFLAVARHPLRVDNGYSDVDVVGVRGDGAVRVAECKVRGGAREVNVDADGNGWTSWWDQSSDNLPRLWQQRPQWLPTPKQVTSLEWQLVGNVWFPTEEARALAEKRLLGAVRAKAPNGLKYKTTVKITSTVDLVLEAASRVRSEVTENGWGKRYGDPLLDALREVIRYAYPKPAGGGTVAQSIQTSTKASFIEAIFGPEKTV